MTSQQFLQIAVACVATTTPWVVARIALTVASRHAAGVAASFPTPAAVSRLTLATAAVLPAALAAAWMLPPPSLWMSSLDVVAFAVLAAFGLKALAAIDAASRPARDVLAAERAASLRPRRLGDYLPLSLRLVPFLVAAAGVTALVWRLNGQAFDRLFMPVAFVVVGPVFLWLYEVWMRAEISGEGSIGEDDALANDRRRRRVRQILAVEVVLVAGLMGLGHALLGVDWRDHGVAVALGAVAGAALGVVGCALALSADLSRRRYRHPGSVLNGG